MKVYERLGVARIEPWSAIRLENGTLNDFDVNTELEWRNQAAAHTDCLLLFKVRSKMELR